MQEPTRINYDIRTATSVGVCRGFLLLSPLRASSVDQVDSKSDTVARR